jgi:hypothetical protein
MERRAASVRFKQASALRASGARLDTRLRFSIFGIFGLLLLAALVAESTELGRGGVRAVTIQPRALAAVRTSSGWNLAPRW